MSAPKLPPVHDLVAPLDKGLEESVDLDAPADVPADGLITVPVAPKEPDTSDTLENGLKGAVAPHHTARQLLPGLPGGGVDKNALGTRKLATDILQHDSLDQSNFDPNSIRVRRNPFAAPAGPLGELQRQREWRERHGEDYNPYADSSQIGGSDTKDEHSALDDDGADSGADDGLK